MINADSQIPITLGALAAVLGLVWLAARLARRFGFTPRGVQATSGAPLHLVGTTILDRTRRLQIIQWGEREIVLLIGGPTDLVVASRILHREDPR